MRALICVGTLLGFLWFVRHELNNALVAYGFWPYIAICGGLLAAIMAAAWSWDLHTGARGRPASRSDPEVLPPPSPTFPPSPRQPH